MGHTPGRQEGDETGGWGDRTDILGKNNYVRKEGKFLPRTILSDTSKVILAFF